MVRLAALATITRQMLAEEKQRVAELSLHRNQVQTSSRVNEENRFVTKKLKPAGRKSSQSDLKEVKIAKARIVSSAPTQTTMVFKVCRLRSQKIIIKT